jgi:hypothetical protein
VFELGSIETEGWLVYDGYNPRETYKLMRQMEENEVVLHRDIKVCCLFTVHRGNKPSKAMKKMPENGQKEISKLISKYSIIDTAPKSKDDITMTRVAGIMPVVCARYMSADGARLVGIKPEKFPKCLCFPGAPCLIPNNDSSLYNTWLDWAMTFNQVIAGGTNSDKVDFFGKVIQQASYLTESQKVSALVSLGIYRED